MSAYWSVFDCERLGTQFELEVSTDASAGICMGNRRRLGKAKRVDTQYHWVQEKTSNKTFQIKKEGTDDMMADVLTKAVPEAKMDKAMKGMNEFSCPTRRTRTDAESIVGLSQNTGAAQAM